MQYAVFQIKVNKKDKLPTNELVNDLPFQYLQFKKKPGAGPQKRATRIRFQSPEKGKKKKPLYPLKTKEH